MSGFTMVEMVWLFKTFGLEEPNTITMHVGTNDMTQGVINISKIRIILITIQELDNTGNLKLGFSNIIKKTEKDNSQ